MPFAGVYSGRAQVGAVNYAVFGDRHAMRLAPWRPALEGARARREYPGRVDGRSVDFAAGHHSLRQIGRALDRDLALEL